MKFERVPPVTVKSLAVSVRIHDGTWMVTVVLAFCLATIGDADIVTFGLYHVANWSISQSYPGLAAARPVWPYHPAGFVNNDCVPPVMRNTCQNVDGRTGIANSAVNSVAEIVGITEFPNDGVPIIGNGDATATQSDCVGRTDCWPLLAVTAYPTCKNAFVSVGAPPHHDDSSGNRLTYVPPDDPDMPSAPWYVVRDPVVSVGDAVSSIAHRTTTLVPLPFRANVG